MAKHQNTDTARRPAKKPRTDKYVPVDLSSTGATFGGSSKGREPSPASVLTISKPTLSLREALLPPAELPPAARISPSKTTRQTTSIAPIFSPRTTFRDGQATPRSSPQKLERVPTPEPDADDLIKRLKNHYLETAETLYERATIQLRQVHSELSRKLDEALRNDSAVLVLMEKQHGTLCRSLSQFQIRYRQRDPIDGSVHEETSSVGDIVATAQLSLNEFEADLRKLWCGWQTAEAEVEAVYREAMREDGADGDGDPDQNELGIEDAGESGEENGDEGERETGEEGEGFSVNMADMEPLNLGKGTLAKFRRLVKQELEDAEKAVEKLCDDAVAEMKEIEREYRKVASSDLRIFFRSIDEP